MMGTGQGEQTGVTRVDDGDYSRLYKRFPYLDAWLSKQLTKGMQLSV